jgi:CheY-like chemotaxis protein
MEHKELQTAFEMFSQFQSHPSSANDGLGIGLSLVRMLVKMHSGKVWAESPGRGKGSTFTIQLPLSDKAKIQEPSAPEPEKKPASGNKRVLIIDDNADVAQSLAMLLKISGREVDVALNGKEAIEKARETSYAIIFLDIGMPEMDGIETSRHLRALPFYDKTVLVALTGWGRESDRQRISEAGFDLHLVKPVDWEAVLEILEKYGA